MFTAVAVAVAVVVFFLGNLSTDDGDARDDAQQKMDLNFTLEFRK